MQCHGLQRKPNLNLYLNNTTSSRQLMQKTAAIMKTEPICIHRATFRNAVPVNLICSETVAVAEEYKLSYHNTTKYLNLKASYPEQSETHQRKKNDALKLK